MIKKCSEGWVTLGASGKGCRNRGRKNIPRKNKQTLSLNSNSQIISNRLETKMVELAINPEQRSLILEGVHTGKLPEQCYETHSQDANSKGGNEICKFETEKMDSSHRLESIDDLETTRAPSQSTSQTVGSSGEGSVDSDTSSSYAKSEKSKSNVHPKVAEGIKISWVLHVDNGDERNDRNPIETGTEESKSLNIPIKAERHGKHKVRTLNPLAPKFNWRSTPNKQNLLSNSTKTSYEEAMKVAVLAWQKLSFEDVQTACSWHLLSVQKTRPIWANTHHIFLYSPSY